MPVDIQMCDTQIGVSSIRHRFLAHWLRRELLSTPEKYAELSDILKAITLSPLGEMVAFHQRASHSQKPHKSTQHSTLENHVFLPAPWGWRRDGSARKLGLQGGAATGDCRAPWWPDQGQRPLHTSCTEPHFRNFFKKITIIVFFVLAGKNEMDLQVWALGWKGYCQASPFPCSSW